MIGAVDMGDPLPRQDNDRFLAIMRVERHRRSGRDGGDAGEHRARPARRGGERDGDDAAAAILDGKPIGPEQGAVHAIFSRSEEHTSELQSLMRISYAVFCLNKKQTKTTKQYT